MLGVHGRPATARAVVSRCHPLRHPVMGAATLDRRDQEQSDEDRDQARAGYDSEKDAPSTDLAMVAAVRSRGLMA
jgi:hypothetical protein